MIGIAGILLAFSQHKLAQAKVRYELFDKRFEIYVAFRELLYHANTKAYPTIEALDGMRKFVDSADFLFNPTYANLLRELIADGDEWRRYNERSISYSDKGKQNRYADLADTACNRFMSKAQKISDISAKMMVIET